MHFSHIIFQFSSTKIFVSSFFVTDAAKVTNYATPLAFVYYQSQNTLNLTLHVTFYLIFMMISVFPSFVSIFLIFTQRTRRELTFHWLYALRNDAKLNSTSFTSRWSIECNVLRRFARLFRCGRKQRVKRSAIARATCDRMFSWMNTNRRVNRSSCDCENFAKRWGANSAVILTFFWDFLFLRDSF